MAKLWQLMEWIWPTSRLPKVETKVKVRPLSGLRNALVALTGPTMALAVTVILILTYIRITIRMSSIGSVLEAQVVRNSSVTRQTQSGKPS
jgi:hypothetical protein